MIYSNLGTANNLLLFAAALSLVPIATAAFYLAWEGARWGPLESL